MAARPASSPRSRCPPDLLRTTVIELRSRGSASPDPHDDGEALLLLAERSGVAARALVGARRHAPRHCAPRSSGRGPARNPHRAPSVPDRCRLARTSRCRRPARGAPSSSAPGRSAPRWRCCWRAAGCARRSRPARPSRPSGSGRARERGTCPRSSCRASCGSRRSSAGLSRADYVFLGVPSRGLDEVIAGLAGRGPGPARGGHLAGQGTRAARRHRADVLLRERFGAERVACVGGPRTRARW